MTIERPLKIACRTAVWKLLSLARSQQDKPGVDFRIGSRAVKDIFSALLQVADIDRSAFHLWRRPLVLQITAFWVRAIPG